MIVVWRNIHRDILVCNSPTLKSRAAIGVWYVGAIKLWFLGATRLWESSLFVGSCFFLAFEKDSYNLGDAKGIPQFPTTEFLTSGMIQENLGGNSTTEKKTTTIEYCKSINLVIYLRIVNINVGPISKKNTYLLILMVDYPTNHQLCSRFIKGQTGLSCWETFLEDVNWPSLDPEGSSNICGATTISLIHNVGQYTNHYLVGGWPSPLKNMT